MSVKAKRQDHKQIPMDLPKVSVEDVKRVLEIGHLLISVLTPEEIKELKLLIEQNTTQTPQVKIGNTGVS